jgi:exosortase
MTLDLARKAPEYTHVVIIIPIFLYLAFCRRDALTPPKFDLAVGLPLLLLAVAGAIWSSRMSLRVPDIRLSISMLLLITWWFGAIALCLGRRVFHLLLFPILLLFWVVPLPEFLLSRVVVDLQQASASFTYLIFQCFGVPVEKNGVVLSIPGLSIEVAKECSSIRSSLILIITSMVLTHLLLRSAWRKWLVILLTIPLSVAKNAVRIFTLSMLGTHVDPSFLTGRLHRQGGIVFFSISVIALWFLIRVLQERDVGHGHEIFGLRTARGTLNS